jgi:CBS domain containing-hemolysin-like protein
VVVTGGEDEEDLLGVVHVIDLLQQQLRGDALDLRALVRQPLVFPETLQLLSALEQFRNARTHFAFVVDEFGSVEGLVTLSDVMETIAGNLPNEVDEIDARHDIQKNPTAPGRPTAICRWKTWCSMCRCRWMRSANTTIAGLLMEYLQRIPQPGEEVQVGDYLIKTLQVESHRVQKVQLIPLRSEDELDFEV